MPGPLVTPRSPWGAGRSRLTDSVDHGAGIVLHMKIGDSVRSGEPLATLYGGTAEAAETLAAEVVSAFGIDAERATPPNVILG